MKKILIIVCGSVAAYKSAYLIDALVKDYEVNVIMTKNACNFITPFQLQCLSKNHVAVDTVNGDTLEVDHIALAKSADAILIAPATANFIGKIANGIADDMASSTLIVRNNALKYFAPAMNTDMYLNPIVQRNISVLADEEWTEIPPREGLLACGEYGIGTLALEEEIIKKVKVGLECT